jgi:hypothetical protein
MACSAGCDNDQLLLGRVMATFGVPAGNSANWAAKARLEVVSEPHHLTLLSLHTFDRIDSSLSIAAGRRLFQPLRMARPEAARHHH